MLNDGKAWAFRGDDFIHSHLGSVPRKKPSEPIVSEDGSRIVYTYGDDDDRRIVIGESELGPFSAALAPGVSPDGRRWIAGYKSQGDQKWYLETEAGKTGPHENVGYALFQGTQSLAQIGLGDSKVSAEIDGISHGPFTEFWVYFLSRLDRSSNQNWAALGIGVDQHVAIFDSGVEIGSTGPFEKFSLLRTNAPHWSGLGREGEKQYLVEDGVTSDAIIPFNKLLFHNRSENARTMSITVKDANEKYFVVMREKTLGPYDQRPGQVTFSADGSHWGFLLYPAEGKSQVVHDDGISPVYDSILNKHSTSPE